jgi:hypothetical protein
MVSKGRKSRLFLPYFIKRLFPVSFVSLKANNNKGKPNQHNRKKGKIRTEIFQKVI